MEQGSPCRHCLPGKDYKLNGYHRLGSSRAGPVASARTTYQVLILFSAATSAGPLGGGLGTISALHSAGAHLAPPVGQGWTGLHQVAYCPDPSKPWLPRGDTDKGLLCARHCSRPSGMWQ